MLFDGKALADTILADLTGQVDVLNARGITPTLAVILVGDDPASLAYIKQKQKAADRIGVSLIFDHQTASLTGGGLYNLIAKYNNDPSIHGLIIQRPIPKIVGKVDDVLAKVQKSKDVDGFLPDSPFAVPVAAAVGEILKSIHSKIQTTDNFGGWLRKNKITVIGRGETAGKPIAEYFTNGRFAMLESTSQQQTEIVRRNLRHNNLGCATSVIHSQTANPAEILKNADIIISCVGKENVVTRDSIKPGAILISVGIWRDATGKLRGDYDEQDIEDVVGWYTPTPGGVGPVNVACLMKNVIKACTMNKGGTI